VGYLPIGFENMTDCVSKVKKWNDRGAGKQRDSITASRAESLVFDSLPLAPEKHS